MTWLKEGSPWEPERGKALVHLFLVQPLLSVCLTYTCSLSLFGHKGVRPHTPASSPVSLREVPGLARIQTKSVALPAAFWLLHVSSRRSVLVSLCFHFVCDPFPFGLGRFPLFMMALQDLVFQPPSQLMFTISKIFSVLLFILVGFVHE